MLWIFIEKIHHIYLVFEYCITHHQQKCLYITSKFTPNECCILYITRYNPPMDQIDVLKYPVITIDGPSGTGKGTVCQLLAHKLAWNYLDSGAIYRVLAFAVQTQGYSSTDADKICEIARNLKFNFTYNEESQSYKIIYNNHDVSLEVRTETCASLASKVSAIPEVRKLLVAVQRNFCQEPGLITDGRDMGTIIFPQAELKFFLDATPEIRAKRRFKQLQQQGINVNLAQILAEVTERDQRDRNRQVAPLVPASDAILIDTSDLSVNEVLEQVLAVIEQKALAVG